MSRIEQILREYVVFLDYFSEETQREIVRRLEDAAFEYERDRREAGRPRPEYR